MELTDKIDLTIEHIDSGAALFKEVKALLLECADRIHDLEHHLASAPLTDDQLNAATKMSVRELPQDVREVLEGLSKND